MPRPSPLPIGLVIGICCLGWPSIAPAGGPADELFELVPPDSALTLAVEDLRGHSREIAGSAFFAELKAVPTVRSWLGSEQYRRFERASRDLGAMLKVNPGAIRDDLLGDAVVLAFQPGPDGKPDKAHGLLLVKVRDRALADRLIATVNDVQSKTGELERVEERAVGSASYRARRFKAKSRPSEYYLLFDDGVFAWTNSEPILQGVVRRKAGAEAGLGDDPAFRLVRKGLPGRSLASLFVDPRRVERALTTPSRPADDPLPALLARYVRATRAVGLAVEWRDGFFLHEHEAIDPERLDPSTRRWLLRPSPSVDLAGRVPTSAVAVLSANIDHAALLDVASELIPRDKRPAPENLRLALRGLLMGLDPTTEVLPRLEPSVLAYLEVEPGGAGGPSFPMVATVAWSDGPGDARDLDGPIDNALRTSMALSTLDPQKGGGRRVEARTVGDSRLTVLADGPRPILAYRVDRGRLVLGDRPEAVARFGIGPPPPALAEVRAKYLNDSGTFAIVDLDRLGREATLLREPIARRLAERSKRPYESVNRDLGQLLALGRLFRAATFSSTASGDGFEVHRALGLIAR